MSFRSIMVGLDLGAGAADRVHLASGMAARFDAILIGAAARRVDYLMVDPTGYGASAAIVAEEEQRIAADLGDVERLFRSAAAGHNSIEWRSGVDEPDTYLAEHARAADLLVLGRQGEGDERDWRFSADPGAVVMAAGRSVLVVPPGVRDLAGQRVLVAWKDTSEARRAIRDALPLLKRAEDVSIVSIGDPPDQKGAADVTRYLDRHGIVATSVPRRAKDATAAETILDVAQSTRADLIVAGAYGHSRTREWIFGGVTRDLLNTSPVCCFMAH